MKPTKNFNEAVIRNDHMSEAHDSGKIGGMCDVSELGVHGNYH